MQGLVEVLGAADDERYASERRQIDGIGADAPLAEEGADRFARAGIVLQDRQLAASYAKGIPMFDPVDSEMIRSGRPA